MIRKHSAVPSILGRDINK